MVTFSNKNSLETQVRYLQEQFLMRLQIIAFIGVFLFSACEGWLVNPGPARPVSLTPDESLTPHNPLIYYVDVENGSDSNSGSKTQPLKTIQKCLDLVQPGDICEIMGGNYNEALVLKNSGKQTAKITIRGFNDNTVIVNSGNEKTLTTSGRIHYYTLEGIRFIANYVAPPAGQGDYSLDFNQGIWDGETNPDGGNNGFILRNCYIEGSIRFYGHNNLVENCELNGLGKFSSGIQERFAPSHDNTYRNNIIHDYTERGIWALQRTRNTLIEGNTIYNIGASGNKALAGIDCDGAYSPDYNCDVIGNTIYNIFGSSGYDGAGVIMENPFEDSSVINNTIYDTYGNGIGVITYGAGPDYYAEKEFRPLDTGLVIANNVVSNTGLDGINCHAAAGVLVTGNTFSNTNQRRSWFGAIGLVPYGGYPCNNWTIENNMIINPAGYALFFEGNPSGLASNYNRYEFSASAKKFVWKTGYDTYYTLAEWQSVWGLDLSSTIGRSLLPTNAPTPPTFTSSGTDSANPYH
jgi:parallel beta-helix repeat protein